MASPIKPFKPGPPVDAGSTTYGSDISRANTVPEFRIDDTFDEAHTASVVFTPPPATSLPPPWTDQTLSSATNGLEHAQYNRKVQRALIKLGFLKNENGNFLGPTIEAVRSFQETNQIAPADGRATPYTQSRLRAIVPDDWQPSLRRWQA